MTPAQAYAQAVRMGQGVDGHLFYTIERSQPVRGTTTTTSPYHISEENRGGTYAQRLYASAINARSSPGLVSNIVHTPATATLSSNGGRVSSGGQQHRSPLGSPSLAIGPPTVQSFNATDFYGHVSTSKPATKRLDPRVSVMEQTKRSPPPVPSTHAPLPAYHPQVDVPPAWSKIDPPRSFESLLMPSALDSPCPKPSQHDFAASSSSYNVSARCSSGSTCGPRPMTCSPISTPIPSEPFGLPEQAFTSDMPACQAEAAVPIISSPPVQEPAPTYALTDELPPPPFEGT